MFRGQRGKEGWSLEAGTKKRLLQHPIPGWTQFGGESSNAAGVCLGIGWRFYVQAVVGRWSLTTASLRSFGHRYYFRLFFLGSLCQVSERLRICESGFPPTQPPKARVQTIQRIQLQYVRPTDQITPRWSKMLQVNSWRYRFGFPSSTPDASAVPINLRWHFGKNTFDKRHPA